MSNSIVATDITIIEKQINHSKSASKERLKEQAFYGCTGNKVAESLFWDYKRELDNLCRSKHYSGSITLFHPTVDKETGEITKKIKNQKNVLLVYCNSH